MASAARRTNPVQSSCVASRLKSNLAEYRTLNKTLRFLRSHQSDVSLVLMVAVGLIGLSSQNQLPVMPGAEMWKLAKNIASQGSFANPFGTLATGPTANNPPLYPLILAGLMKVFRVPALIYVASVLCAIIANAFTAALLPRASMIFFGDSIPGVFGALLWLGAMQSIPGWDTNFTVAGILLYCILTAPGAQAERNTMSRAVLGGTIAGLLFLLNPSSVLIVVPWIGFLLLNSGQHRSTAIKQAVLVLGLLVTFGMGWAIRNYFALGALVSRTNLGIALYVSNNDCAQSSLIRDELNNCYQTHHPNASVAEAEELHRLGEIQYDRMRTADTKVWIRSHGAQFANLTLTRIKEFWFPATENIPATIKFANAFNIPNYSQIWSHQQNRIARVMWLITALSIPGLILMGKRREAVTLYMLAVSAIYPLMYYVVVSDMRYRYPVLWLSLLQAGYFLREFAEGRVFGFFRSSSPAQ